MASLHIRHSSHSQEGFLWWKVIGSLRSAPEGTGRPSRDIAGLRKASRSSGRLRKGIGAHRKPTRSIGRPSRDIAGLRKGSGKHRRASEGFGRRREASEGFGKAPEGVGGLRETSEGVAEHRKGVGGLRRATRAPERRRGASEGFGKLAGLRKGSGERRRATQRLQDLLAGSVEATRYVEGDAEHRQAKERQKDVGRCVKSPKWLQRLEEGVSKRSRASEGVKHQRKPTQAHGWARRNPPMGCNGQSERSFTAHLHVFMMYLQVNAHRNLELRSDFHHSSHSKLDRRREAEKWIPGNTSRRSCHERLNEG